MKTALKCKREENEKKEMSVRTRRGYVAGKVELERKGGIVTFLKQQKENELLESSIGRNDKTIRSPEGEKRQSGIRG